MDYQSGMVLATLVAGFRQIVEQMEDHLFQIHQLAMRRLPKFQQELESK